MSTLEEKLEVAQNIHSIDDGIARALWKAHLKRKAIVLEGTFDRPILAAVKSIDKLWIWKCEGRYKSKDWVMRLDRVESLIDF